MHKKFVLACLIIAFFIVSCTQQKIKNGINPVQQSELDNTTSIIIYDLYTDSGAITTILDSPEDIEKVVHSLDNDHAVTPKTFCAPRYRLEFEQKNGSSVEINYFCDDNAPFIRSELGYFENEDYAVKKEFVDIMEDFLDTKSNPGEAVPEENEGPPLALANPASVFCEEQGGTVEMREDESGGQYGVCLFEDGSECEEWKYFRGECEPGE